MNLHGIETRPAAIVGSRRTALRRRIRRDAERRVAPDAGRIAVLGLVTARRECTDREIRDAGRSQGPAGLPKFPTD